MKFFVQLSIGLCMFVQVLSAMDNVRQRAVSDAEMQLLRKTVVCCFAIGNKAQEYHESFKNLCGQSPSYFDYKNRQAPQILSNSIFCCCLPVKK